MAFSSASGPHGGWKPPPDAGRPRRRTGAESEVELAGDDTANGTRNLHQGGGARC